MPPEAALLSLSTSVPPHIFPQKDILDAAWEVFGSRFPDYGRFASIFANTGIIKRHGVKPFDWYLTQRGWPERTEAFFEGAEALFIEAATGALAKAHLAAADVDTVVTVCSTGIATPSLDARIAKRMGFRSDVSRVPVFGLGCAGGASGLSIASRLAQSRPGTNVLMVTVELCTLALRLDELSKANIIATSLFGDGAAAIVLRAGDGGETLIEAVGEHLWPDTLDVMGWNIDPLGFGVILRRTIPEFVTSELKPALTQILARMDRKIADYDKLIFHPGGAKVIDAIETALSLHQGTLEHERAVIADYGNMSAPTLLFILERNLAKGLAHRSLLTALGPGFTASCVSLRRAA
ncbi:type III polyketide synthase [Bradyrhizobium sp.]|uniref:type III polyketide synthase n=1 Tax=Bradyrhizobium sp. TaxID=376 RepID=UPI002605EF49|nr:type III polyketide synthase [Bradyrhizobium sp.]